MILPVLPKRTILAKRRAGLCARPYWGIAVGAEADPTLCAYFTKPKAFKRFNLAVITKILNALS